MLVTLKGQQYYVDEQKIVDRMKSTIEPAMNNSFVLPNGIKFDLKGRSLLATAMRQLFGQFIIPLLEFAAEKVNLTLPKKEKHADVIQYCVTSYYSIFLETLRDTELKLIDVPYVDEIRQISEYSLLRQIPDIVDSIVLLPQVKE